MKKILTIIFILMLIQGFIAYSESSGSTKISIESIKAQLNEIEKTYISSLSFDQRREAISKMNILYENIMILSGNSVPINKDHSKFSKELMNSDIFSFFKKELKAAWPDKEKFKIYLKYLMKYHITVDQLMEVCTLITFDSDKIEAITLIFPAIIDKENSIKLLNAVSDKAGLSKSLGF